MSYQIKDADGKNIKHQGKDLMAMDSIGVIKAVNQDKRTLLITGSTEAKDRDGDIIRTRGWNIENYQKNPVFLWNHDYSSVPLGAAKSIKKRRGPNRLDFEIRFPKEGIFPFADMILNLYEEKIINASSVGFIPKEWDELEKEGGQWYRPRDYKAVELLELSGCAVPSNPEALQNALKSKSFFDSPQGQAFAAYMTGEAAPELLGKLFEDKRDDVMDALNIKGIEIEIEGATQVQVHKNTPIEKPEEKEDLENKDLETDDVEEKDIDEYKKSIEILIVGMEKVFELKDAIAALSSDMSKAVMVLSGDISDDVQEKVGAVLNQKNQSLLKEAQAKINQVLEAAAKPEEDDEGDSYQNDANRLQVEGPDGSNGKRSVYDEILEEKPDLKLAIRVLPKKETDSERIKRLLEVVKNLKKAIS